MQFSVPQFIESEDKIVGPFSLRQFGYIAAAGLSSFFLFYVVEMWLWFLLSVILVGLGIGFALVKINGRPLAKMVISAIRFYWSPQRYVWQPDEPSQAKTPSTATERSALERVVSGLALKRALRYVQTGSESKEEEAPNKKEKRGRYQLLHRITGEHEVAKRVDYKY